MPDPIILEMKPKFANFSAHNMHSLNLSAILYGTRVFGLDTSGQGNNKTLLLCYLLPTYETSLAFIAIGLTKPVLCLCILCIVLYISFLK